MTTARRERMTKSRRLILMAKERRVTVIRWVPMRLKEATRLDDESQKDIVYLYAYTT